MRLRLMPRSVASFGYDCSYGEVNLTSPPMQGSCHEKAQQRAAQEGWDLETWKKYQCDPDIYRPEKALTNLGHQHESDW